MGDVPEVAVTAVALAHGERKIDAVLLAVLDLILTGLHGPDICHSPGSDDLQVRSQSLDAELEADLVISFSCRAVADRCRALLAGNLDELLCDQRAGHRGAEQVFVLIDSARVDAGHDVVVSEFIDDVFNI